MASLTFTVFSKALQHNSTVNVIIPDDIKPKEKLKVLYLLHGYMGDHTDWTRFTSIERYAWGLRLAIVMPANYNSYYTNMKHGINAYDYYAKELPEFIENLLPISKKREDHYIAGLSMGGYGALKAALSRPNYFFSAASLSGVTDVTFIRNLPHDSARTRQYQDTFGSKTDGTSNDLRTLIERIESKNQTLPNLYIACGATDFLIESNKAFHAYLDAKKIPHVFEVAPGAHEWSFWDFHIQRVLNWMFRS